MKNYYKILEVEPTASLEQIKIQHRFMVHAWHPDKFPDGELKAKADEKIKEINEAYSILSDTAKRDAYDKVLLSYSPPPEQSSYSQPIENSSHAKPTQNCQSCGLPNETKYIEFYENVGLLLMRQHRSVKGNLCKPCIDYYFWNFTGKTMLLGWWGIISFIVTPFILLNNLLRFIFSRGMKKPPLQITPNPSPFWVFSAICGFLIIGFSFCSIFTSVFAQPTYSPSPTTSPTNITKAIHIPAKVKTPTVQSSNCIQWSKVSSAMIGKEICVYGNVYKIKSVGASTTQILFSSNQESFFLAGGTYYYDVNLGDCVLAEGEVLRSGSGVPYMDIDEALYMCESWMK
jgi:hypothetical protein